MTIAAIAAVTRNVTVVTPMTFPALPGVFMLAIADEIEQNTIGTTTQNIMLMKRSPSGDKTVAPGQTSPVIVPSAIAIIIETTKP